MDFELSDEQAMLREASRAMLAAHSPISAAQERTDGAEFDPDLWRLAGELGWTGLALPEEHGGAGQGLVELALVAEEIGRALARGPFLSTALVGLAVARGGSEYLRTAVLPGLAEGTESATWAFAEHGTPWTPEALRTTVHAMDGHVVIDGVKTAVQDADAAHRLLVTARHGDTPVSVLVDRDAPGLTVRRQEVLDLTRAFSEVRFDGVRVPAERVIGGGPAAVRRLLDDACVLTAAETLGVVQRLLDLTVEYVSIRVQFGRPIGSFQAVKQKCATMALLVHGARAATYQAAMAADAGTADAARAACAAAAHTSAAAPEVAGEALQLHGGIGFTWEHDLHLYLRRAEVDAVLHGDAALHHDRMVDLLAPAPA